MQQHQHLYGSYGGTETDFFSALMKLNALQRDMTGGKVPQQIVDAQSIAAQFGYDTSFVDIFSQKDRNSAEMLAELIGRLAPIDNPVAQQDILSELGIDSIGLRNLVMGGVEQYQQTLKQSAELGTYDSDTLQLGENVAQLAADYELAIKSASSNAFSDLFGSDIPTLLEIKSQASNAPSATRDLAKQGAESAASELVKQAVSSGIDSRGIADDFLINELYNIYKQLTSSPTENSQYEERAVAPRPSPNEITEAPIRINQPVGDGVSRATEGLAPPSAPPITPLMIPSPPSAPPMTPIEGINLPAGLATNNTTSNKTINHNYTIQTTVTVNSSQQTAQELTEESFTQSLEGALRHFTGEQ